MKELSAETIYINDLCKHGLLSKEEIFKLAEKARSGDISARKKIITSNLRLVIKIAHFYARKYHANLEDLIASGNIGLVIAAQKFNADYKACFTTYAQFWIRDEIRKFLNGNHDIVLPKKRAADLSKKYNTYAESIDDENFCEGNISSEYSVNVEEEVCRKMAGEGVRKFVQKLPEKDRKIISMHYGIGSDKKTMEEIGSMLMKSKQWVSKEISRVVKNARCYSMYPYLNNVC